MEVCTFPCCRGFLSIPAQAARLHFQQSPSISKAIFTYLRQKELRVGGQIISLFISAVRELKWQGFFRVNTVVFAQLHSFPFLKETKTTTSNSIKKAMGKKKEYGISRPRP